MLTDKQIIEHNPWWTRGAGWRDHDPHLRRLARQPARFPSQVVSRADIDSAAVHIVRGPRQVGKSTDLKLLVERALESGRTPRQVIYLAFDLLEDQPSTEFARTVQRAKQLADPSSTSHGSLLLLDEVTSVPRWQNAVKALWDEGAIDGDVVYCTGSSAADLAFGAAERLPGRRGQGADHLVLPQSFAEFARALHPDIPSSPRLLAGDIFTDTGAQALHAATLHGHDLEDALLRYVRFGGLPVAVAEALQGELEPSAIAQRVVLDSLVKEVRRRNISEPALHALLERIALSLGSKTSWHAMAQAMEVSLTPARGSLTTDSRTLRHYIEFLSVGYFAFIAYFWKHQTDANAISRDKKIFFGDPLLYTVAKSIAPGLPDNVPGIVENVVGLTLLRRYEPAPSLFEGFLAPRDIHVWESTSGGELDFACGGRGAPDLIEVKYQSTIDRRIIAGYRRSFPQRPIIVASRNTTNIGALDAVIPAHILLWLLG